MRDTLISVLDETLAVFRNGYYDAGDRSVVLSADPAARTACTVILPEEVDELVNSTQLKPSGNGRPCRYDCRNTDSFDMAQDMVRRGKDVLVLNLANPVHPGGGVRRGAVAQEEDLCRRSSLLLSLESEEAARYYRYNSRLHTFMGSDALIFTPHVEVIRGSGGQFLSEPFAVSVVTCAAPMITYGLEGMSEAEYRRLFARRIEALLKGCACMGYRNLVLGALGCGAFGNDARLVSDLFAEVLGTLKIGGYTADDLFDEIGFAVLCRRQTYNYDEFARNFRRKDPSGLIGTMMKRRSVRRYTGKAVPPESLRKILDAGLLAPSSRNLKPCRFYAVTDRKMLVSLSKVKQAGASFLKDAGAAVIVTASKKVSDTWIEDCSIAMTYMNLAASEEGIGSCWVQIRLRSDAAGNEAAANVRALLGLEDDMGIVGILSLGMPAEQLPAHTEDDMDLSKIRWVGDPS